MSKDPNENAKMFRLPEITEDEVARYLDKLAVLDKGNLSEEILLASILETITDIDPFVGRYIAKFQVQQGAQYNPEQFSQAMLEFVNLMNLAGTNGQHLPGTVPRVHQSDFTDLADMLISGNKGVSLKSVDYMQNLAHIADQFMPDFDELSSVGYFRDGEETTSKQLAIVTGLLYILMHRAAGTERLENEYQAGRFRGRFTVTKIEETANGPRYYGAKEITVQSRYEEGKHLISLGRNLDNDIILDDNIVSRRHCLLILDNGEYLLVDKSRLGTGVLDGNELTVLHNSQMPSKNEGEIIIGHRNVQYHLES